MIGDDTELLLLDKNDDRLEAVGLSLAKAKTLLAGVQNGRQRQRGLGVPAAA